VIARSHASTIASATAGLVFRPAGDALLSRWQLAATCPSGTANQRTMQVKHHGHVQASPAFGPVRNVTRLGLGLRTASGAAAPLGSRRGEAPIEIDMEDGLLGSAEPNVSLSPGFVTFTVQQYIARCLHRSSMGTACLHHVHGRS
jgi:hypothetical protein